MRSSEADAASAGLRAFGLQQQNHRSNTDSAIGRSESWPAIASEIAIKKIHGSAKDHQA